MTVNMLRMFVPFLVHITCVLGICDLSSEPNIKQFDIRIPEMEVPKKLTHYVCQQFKVPDNEDYNAVAFEGLIGNPDAVHHILLFGCDFDVEQFEPHECGNYDGRCRSWLAQWTIGVDGKICTYKDAGIRFGKNFYKYMSLQIHWNNNQFDINQSDSSGIRLYYTNKLRDHEVGNVQIGQNDLEIPTGSSRTLQMGSCSQTCTQRILPHPIYLTKTYIHMHNLGIEGKLEIYRDGHLVTEVAHDDVYDYHKSPIHYHEPVEVKPGDEVRLTCWYKSGNNHTIYWGEGSDAEMCYAFVTYFPKVSGFDQCIQFEKYDVNCHIRGEPYMGGCSFQNFEYELQSSLTEEILSKCQPNGICEKSCFTSLRKLLEHPCKQGRFKDYTDRLFPSRVQHWNKLEQTIRMYEISCQK